MKWGCAKAHTFFASSVCRSFKGQNKKTTDVIRNSSLAICSSQHLSCHSMPLRWYYLYILIFWWKWFLFVRLFNTVLLVRSLSLEVFCNLYMCTKILYCYFSSVLEYICVSSFRKWVCEFSSFTKSAWNYWWWEWLRQSHAYKVSASTWRR